MSKDNIVMAGWHLKKEVTIGQLITMVMILISGIWWASSVETRITELSSERIRLEQKVDIVVENINNRFDSYQKNIERTLGRIERKQDKLFDKLESKQDK